MRSHFNPQTIANKVLMLRSQFRGSYLLVEGDTDCRFFSNLSDISLCRIIPADGKSNVIDTLIELEKRGARGILGIVDADFWIIEGTKPRENLLLTDTHDLETMILVSPALEKVLKEFLPGEMINDCIDRLASEVRRVLLTVGRPIGSIRWISRRERFDLDFEAFPFDQCVDFGCLSVDVLRAVKAVRAGVRDRLPLTDRDLHAKVIEISRLDVDGWQVCQGHDLVYLLELILPVILEKMMGRAVAENARRKAHAAQLDRDLRVAYEAAYFLETVLYSSIKEWESINRPFRILGLSPD
jgi:hypothetical protein